MTREAELEAMDLIELKDLFVSELRKIVSKGAERGLTEQQSLVEYPFIMEAIEEIHRISKCSIEELESEWKRQ